MGRASASVLVLALTMTNGIAAPQLKEKGQDRLFFPVTTGTTWTYRIGSSDVSYVVTAAERTDDGTAVRVSRVQDAGKATPVMTVLVNEKGVYLVEEVGQAYDPPWCIFKNPAAPGDRWDTATSRPGLGKMTDVRTAGKPQVLELASRKVTAIPVEVTNMSYEGKEQKRTYWWANGIGWAKIQVGEETTRELSSFTLGKK